jgi:sulfate adenylyltransferase (ADP) / ATP adenylyltransferase
MIPRKEEHHTLQETGEILPVNSLGFAGMLLVKSERELEAVVSEGVGKVLKSVGIKSVHDEMLAEGSDMVDDNAPHPSL